jgi:hypothetical protein
MAASVAANIRHSLRMAFSFQGHRDGNSALARPSPLIAQLADPDSVATIAQFASRMVV